MRWVVTFAALAAVLAGQAEARSAPKSNLTLAAVSLAANSVAPGSGLAVSETTSNRGSAPAAKSVTAYFLSADAHKDARDRRIGSRNVPALKPRKRSAKRVTLQIPASQPVGAFRLIACADDKRKVKEQSERDNCRVAPGAVSVSAIAPVAPGGTPAPPPADSPPPTSPTPTPTPPADTPTPPAGPTTSEQIATARSAPDGGTNVAIAGAVVTYLKPAVGSDPAGFFVQADKTGPALPVAVNPLGLIPSPAVGDRVSFTVNAMGTLNGVRGATAISGFTRTATGVDVAALLQDVSASSDLVTALGSYESELIRLGATITGPFAAAGGGHVSAPINTGGVLGDPNLRLRVPTTLRDDLDLDSSCGVRLEAGPMWRNGAVAQPSAYSASDLTVLSCPAPTVVSAIAGSATSVTLTFSRHIDAASVLADGSQFSADSGLTFSAAGVSGKTVTLTSSPQSTGTTYTVTAGGSVTDEVGTALGNPNSAMFAGFEPMATLMLNEINPNITSSHDLIELKAVAGGTIRDITVKQIGSATETLVTMPSVVVAVGDLIVVHLTPATATGAAPGSETLSKNQYNNATFGANYDNAWDIHGGTTGLTFSNRVIRVDDPLLEIQDGVPFVQLANASPPAAFPGALQALQAAGEWSPADCGGALCTYASTPTAQAISVAYDGAGTTPTGNSVQHKPVADANTKADWNTAAAQTFGADNP